MHATTTIFLLLYKKLYLIIHLSVMAVSVKMEDEGALGCGCNGPLFSPPLYKQRYSAVVAVARRLQAKKVSSTHSVTHEVYVCV